MVNFYLLIRRLRGRIGTLFIAIFYYRIPEFRGKLNLLFFNTLYPNFKTGNNPKVWGKFFIVMYDPINSSIEIGDNLWMVSEEKRSGITFFCKSKLTTIGTGVIKIGNNVALNGSVITSKKRIEIGDNTMLAPNVIIIDSDFHAHWPPENRFQQVDPALDKEVIIGRNVWIGMNSIIVKGVTIGDNSMIGAGSVVTSNIPSNVIATGSPARVVKKLT
jgi:acetyltransferase-like isoleucine patch superfamily enzyme